MSLADKSSLLFIPTGYKESKIYSVFPSTGVGDFTFNRNSSATRIAKNGLITSVATDIPRLEYPLIDGVVNGCPSLLLEPSRTNLITYSEDFSQSIWSKANTTITPNTSISPDGSLNGGSLFETTANTYHDLSQSYVTSIGVVYHFSCFVKPNGRDYCYLYSNSEGDKAIKFDVKKGIIIGAALGTDTGSKITNFDNGWYRIEMKTTATSSGNKLFVISPTNNGSSSIGAYVGDTSKGILVWGAMLEIGSYSTSYISTTTAAVTRSAETANGAGDATTFNDSEGVLMAEISALADDGTVRSIAISGSVTNDVVRFYYDGVSNGITAFVYDGAYQSVFTTVVNDITENNKIAFSYKLNEFKLFINGLQVGFTDTNGAIPNGLDGLKFDNGSGAEDFYGKVKQLQYYNSALTDSELEQLTSWLSFTDMAQGQLYTIE